MHMKPDPAGMDKGIISHNPKPYIEVHVVALNKYRITPI